MKKIKTLSLFVVSVGLFLGLALLIGQPTVSAQEGNYLTNPSFEGAYSDFTPLVQYQKDACKLGVCTTAQMPAGWLPFWKPQEDSDPGWRNRMPEYKPVCPFDPCPFPERLKDGAQALQYFTFFGTHEGGLMQQATVPANQTLKFSVWGMAWSTNDDNPTSGFPSPVNMRVGIDPTGEFNPYSPNVVWSEYANVYDNYALFEVAATAQGDKVTVFMWSSPTEQRKHNDIYWDGAALTNFDGTVQQVTTTTVNEDGETVEVPVAAAPVRFSAGPTPTPNAEGTILVEVQAGDTLWSIAARAGLSLDELLALNPGLNSGSFVNPGQFLILGQSGGGAPVVAVEAEATPEPETAEGGEVPEEETAEAAVEETTEEVVEEEAAAEEIAQVEVEEAAAEEVEVVEEVAMEEAMPVGASVCLRAFDDLNGDGVFNTGDTLRKGVAFTIANQQAVVSNYITTGETEPYCVEGLEAGNYRVSRSFAENEVPTNGSDWGVALSDGTVVDIDFGSQMQEAAPVEVAAMVDDTAESSMEEAEAITSAENAAEAAAADSGGGLYSWLIWIIVGIAVVLIIGVALVVFSASRATVD